PALAPVPRSPAQSQRVRPPRPASRPGPGSQPQPGSTPGPG
ncbi:hypothetical protein HMPREF0058_2036, partial [Actinomyces urogenitalis DSM 15434]